MSGRLHQKVQKRIPAGSSEVASTVGSTLLASHQLLRARRSKITSSASNRTPMYSNASKQSSFRNPVLSAKSRSETLSAVEKSFQITNARRLAQNRRYVAWPKGESGNSGPRRAWPGVTRAKAYRNSTSKDPKRSLWNGGKTQIHARLLSSSQAFTSLEKKPMGFRRARSPAS